MQTTAERKAAPDLTVRTSFKWLFWLFVTITGFHVGYTMAYTNQTAPTLNAKFDWHDTATLYQSMIGSFAVGAMMVGATLGGKLIQYGRLRLLFIASLIGIVGTAATLVLQLEAILAGRLLYGLATGFIAVAMPRYIDEVLPSSLHGLFGGLYCFSFAIATIIAYLLALGLPVDKLDDDTENTAALKADKFWRVIFGLPILFFVLQDIMTFTFCKYESPKFLILAIEAVQKRMSEL